MATKITAKKPLVGNRRSHAMNATKHSQRTNEQTITINGHKIITTVREARSCRKAPRVRKCDIKEQKAA